MSIRSVQHVLIAICLAAFSASGCGSRGPVLIPIRGEVSVDGKPAKDGMVYYLPASPDAGRQASGRIQPDGTFALSTFHKADGVIPAEYVITVTAFDAPASGSSSREEIEKAGGKSTSGPKMISPKKYNDPTASGLKDTVDRNHSGFHRIELNSMESSTSAAARRSSISSSSSSQAGKT
jgi:hypothetical protein